MAPILPSSAAAATSSTTSIAQLRSRRRCFALRVRRALFGIPLRRRYERNGSRNETAHDQPPAVDRLPPRHLLREFARAVSADDSQHRRENETAQSGRGDQFAVLLLAEEDGELDEEEAGREECEGDGDDQTRSAVG